MSDTTRFILMQTSHPGNVGAAARAMKVMGFSDLVLVQPRFADVLSQEETVAMASGAADILARARIVDSLEQALDGVSFACATAMTPRDFGPPTHAPRALFPELAASGHRVAFVFGSERYGMANEDVYRCHAVLSLPTHPDYGSLSHRSVDDMDQGEGVEGSDRKEDPLDFALWKAQKEGEDTAWDALER